MYRAGRSLTRGISTAIILLGLALSFAFGGFNLPIFFVALAFAILVGSLGTFNPRGVYGGFMGFIWMLMLALFFVTGSWVWFIVGAAISALLGALVRPILAGLLGVGLFSAFANQQRPPQYYQPPQQPYQPTQQPYQPYQQGYQTPQEEAGYQEGERQHQYPPTPTQNAPQYQPYTNQADQPQAQYPQQMPPQQQ